MASVHNVEIDIHFRDKKFHMSYVFVHIVKLCTTLYIIHTYVQSTLYEHTINIHINSEHIPSMLREPIAFVLIVLIGLYMYLTGEAGDAR